MTVRQRDIVLVDFRYSDHTGSKVRPVPVVDVWKQRPTAPKSSEGLLIADLSQDWPLCSRTQTINLLAASSPWLTAGELLRQFTEIARHDFVGGQVSGKTVKLSA